MLDRHKLMKEISSVAARLFPDDEAYLKFYQETWQELAHDNSYVAYIRSLPDSSLAPLWEGGLQVVVKVDSPCIGYSVLGIDGSQVYPDRHISGAGCFLINSGGCWTWYGQPARAELFSDPQIFLQHQAVIPGVASSIGEDFVDLLREQYELEAAVKKSSYYANIVRNDNYLCMFDGDLIFWYLESKHDDIQSYFLDKYTKSLAWFYENRVLVAGYISFPKSRELTNLIRVRLCLSNDVHALPCFGKIENCPCVIADDIVDSTIVSWFLPEGYRTIVFSNRTRITKLYPDWLKPYFFYLNVGNEIVRIEVPKWVVQQPGALDTVCAIILDQAYKGRGYPVVLAEAHEQAVVRVSDREFFFELIRKAGMERNKPVLYSQKSIKKRNMSI